MSPTGTRRVSSKDVADAAGVSRTTVSFVLNDRPNVSIPGGTRRRVWAAAHALGYTPSPEARALRFGRSAIVLCLLPDWPITGPLGVLLEELSAELAKAGLTMLSHQRSPGDDLSSVLAALTPTAIVALCDLSPEEVELAELRGIDIKAFMGRVPGREDVANLKQTDIGRLQIEALAELGHSHMAYVSPSDRKLDWFSEPRRKGARSRAAELGVQLTHFRIPARTGEKLQKWLADSAAKGLTAICAYNDEVAFTLLMAAADQGLLVPDDVSLIGVDDTTISRLTRPTLSTIGFGLAREAERLAAMITSTDDRAREDQPADVLELELRGSVRRL